MAMNIRKAWTAKSESTYSFMLKYSKITLCVNKQNISLKHQNCPLYNALHIWLLIALLKKYRYHLINIKIQEIMNGPYRNFYGLRTHYV